MKTQGIIVMSTEENHRKICILLSVTYILSVRQMKKTIKITDKNNGLLNWCRK